MKVCPFTYVRCMAPHLSCRMCGLPKMESLDKTLVRERAFSLPDTKPFVKIRMSSPRGEPGFGVEIGVRGTF